MSKAPPPTVSSKIGLKELARSLNLDPGTVSRALNNRYGVNKATRKRVLDQAKSMGYSPNAAARQLKDHPVLRVEIFFSPFVSTGGAINPTALNLIDAITRAIQSDGMSSRTVFFSEEEFHSRLGSGQIDVAVMHGAFAPEHFAAVHASGIPAIVLQTLSEHPSQVCILHDTEAAGFRAAEYLAALGHERIAMINGPLIGWNSAGMRNGFNQAYREFRLEWNPDYFVELSKEDSSREGAYAAVSKMLALPTPPTAIVCDRDWFVLGAMQAARDRNLRLPEDLSLIGYDNFPMAAELTPALTTFDWNPTRAARIISTLAMELGKHKWSNTTPENKQVLIIPDLIKRDSCTSLRPERSYPF